jgi:hypothetical protein
MRLALHQLKTNEILMNETKKKKKFNLKSDGKEGGKQLKE